MLGKSLATAAAGAAGGAEVIYIEDVMSTYLYTGTGNSQTITNEIDLAGEGGLVWIKSRSAVGDHGLWDTTRGAGYELSSNSTGESSTPDTTGLSAFTSSGFSIGVKATYNTNGAIYNSWTFRKAEKFFDVVTYTGTGSARTIAHNLGSVPGCIIVKRTDTTSDWQVYHRANTASPETDYLVLNSTAATADSNTRWNDTLPTSAVFSVGTDVTVNASGGTYVAYLFAHTESVITCGSYAGNGSSQGSLVNLGWEPQWLLIKNSSSTGDWQLIDNMRGFVVGLGADAELNPNLSSSESSGVFVTPTSTGFQPNTTDAGYNSSGSTYVYVAIRRGPMRTPEDATKVFQPKVYTGTNVDNRLVTTDIVTDMVWVRQRNDTVLAGMVVGDRLRGQPYLRTGTAATEVNDSDSFDQQFVSLFNYGTAFSSMTGFWVGNDATSKLNASTTSNNHIAYALRRAPGFFDVVCYTGTGADLTVNHNLAEVPELIIVKSRNDPTSWTLPWGVYHKLLTGSQILGLNSTDRITYGSPVLSVIPPTQVDFVLKNGTFSPMYNSAGYQYVAYLFASCPGVSKVDSYTGTGTTLNIDCGFTAGARFVLIKRIDDTGGDWYVWDTARGIASGNDPYLLLNSTSAEVTSTDYIDPLSSGFQISSSAPAAINASGGLFIFLAIA